MTLGAMTWTCLFLTAAAPPDVWHLNQKVFQIPIRFDAQHRAEIHELDLYVSHDQGQSWNLEGRTTPDKEYFPYVAREDGPYWFTVVVIDQKGQQTPQDVHAAPVGQRIVVDTVRPDVKLTAERQGETVKVEWAITEEHPKPESLKLEYAESANGPWTTVAVKPGPVGRAEFQTAAAVTVRMQVQDMAENQGLAIRQVPAADGASASAASPFPPPPPPLVDNAAGPLPPPAPPPLDPPPAPTPDRTRDAFNWVPRPTDPAPGPVASRPPLPPPPAPPAPVTPDAPPPMVARGNGNQVVAFSQAQGPAPTPTPPGPTYGQDASTPPHGMMPPVQVVNKRTVKMEFDVGKYGPSGLGGVDVWVTTDDGATWEKSGVDPNAMLPASPDALNAGPVRGSVTLQLNQEGVTYGYYLVVKSRAGLGKPDPKAGDAPQVRVELDATPPEAKLIKPEPDAARPDTLILAWIAKDKHLTANPIALEWAAQPDGPWNVIGAAELPNTGAADPMYAGTPEPPTGLVRWKPPANVPPSVYLRLTVRDTAGNKAVAQTPKPELIDLSVPEVSNIGLGDVNVNPPDPR